MKNNTPGWKRMSFKGNKVWLSVDEKETPIVKNGKVLIKYQINQDYEYWVHENSLKSVDPSNLKQRKKKSQKTNSKKEENGINASGNPDAICIYTDGASSGNPGPSGIGAVLIYKNHKKEISKHIGDSTNNIAELEAIRIALSEVKNKDLPVRLHTDSGYAFGLLKKGWKAKKNVELVTSIRRLMKHFKDLEIIKVKGHAGVPENERADKLATSAIKELSEPE